MDKDPQLHPDFFRGKSPMKVRRRPDRAPFRKWRDVFHYHYRTQREQCCMTCKFVRYNSTRRRWQCRLQNHRVGPFWVCMKWVKNLLKKGWETL